MQSHTHSMQCFLGYTDPTMELLSQRHTHRHRHRHTHTHTHTLSLSLTFFDTYIGIKGQISNTALSWFLRFLFLVSCFLFLFIFKVYRCVYQCISVMLYSIFGIVKTITSFEALDNRLSKTPTYITNFRILWLRFFFLNIALLIY